MEGKITYRLETQNLRIGGECLQFGDNTKFTRVESVSEDRLCDSHELFVETHLLDSWEDVGRLKKKMEGGRAKKNDRGLVPCLSIDQRGVGTAPWDLPST